MQALLYWLGILGYDASYSSMQHASLLEEKCRRGLLPYQFLALAMFGPGSVVNQGVAAKSVHLSLKAADSKPSLTHPDQEWKHWGSTSVLHHSCIPHGDLSGNLLHHWQTSLTTALSGGGWRAKSRRRFVVWIVSWRPNICSRKGQFLKHVSKLPYFLETQKWLLTTEIISI